MNKILPLRNQLFPMCSQPDFASFTLKNNEQINNNFRREVGNMRRMFRLSDASHKDIDLREYEDEILEIADRIIPGKNSKVYQNYFMTDELTQGERVRLGRELSKSPRLKQYGKEMTSFRLFEGKSVEEKEEEKDGRNTEMSVS